jgi:very-short-patch-repair endonuclease
MRGPYRNRLVDGRDTARELRREQTPAEERFWELVRNRRFDGHKFRRQHRLGPWFLDFYCPALRLAIEIDGPIHDQQPERDAWRDASITGEALIDVIHLRNESVLNNPTAVLDQLRTIIAQLPNNPSTTASPLHFMERGPGVRPVQDRPSQHEILDAVQRFLDDEVVPVTQGRTQFLVRVAANLLRALDRELTLEETQLAREWDGLNALLGAEQPPAGREALREALRRRNAALCERIRAGAADEDEARARILAHVRRTVQEKLAVTNPALAGH